MVNNDTAQKSRPPFDESLISGYLDGELTQVEAQRVRLYLEDHSEARALFEEMKQMREATLTTEFILPRDDQWSEKPRGSVSRLSRGVGWVMVVAWLILLGGFGLWQMAVAPVSLGLKLVIFGGLSGFAFLMISVGMDRIRLLPQDRYRRVEK